MYLKPQFFLLLILFAFSCKYHNKIDYTSPIARVNDRYLYFGDIVDIVPEGTSIEDSTLIVQNYINKWATQQLLLDGALINLSEAKQKAFDNLVEQYKTDLYTNAYAEAIVKQNVDTVVSFYRAFNYYKNNREAFKLNEELIKFRYVHVDENIIDFDSIKNKFQRYNEIDKNELDSISVQFKSYSLNDSIWIKVKQVVEKIPAINSENKNQLLKKSNFMQLKDSLGVYLIQINDVLLRNDTAPLEYIKPTIDQIVINRRKLELIKKLETDITKDAIKNKQFEIFD